MSFKGFKKHSIFKLDGTVAPTDATSLPNFFCDIVLLLLLFIMRAEEYFFSYVIDIHCDHLDLPKS